MRETVLVIGQEGPARKKVEELMIREGLRVQSANDAIAGIFQVLAAQPRLIIVDLPDRDTLHRMRRASSAPIIALTGEGTDAGLESLESGADFYVNKPPAPDELCAKVRASLRRA